MALRAAFCLMALPLLVAVAGALLPPTAAHGRNADELMPYRDVQPPASYEDPASLWLSGLPRLENTNPALQWCDHYSDPVPPIWDTGHAGVELKAFMKSEYQERSGASQSASNERERERESPSQAGPGIVP